MKARCVKHSCRHQGDCNSLRSRICSSLDGAGCRFGRAQKVVTLTVIQSFIVTDSLHQQPSQVIHSFQRPRALDTLLVARPELIQPSIYCINIQRTNLLLHHINIKTTSSISISLSVSALKLSVAKSTCVQAMSSQPPIQRRKEPALRKFTSAPYAPMAMLRLS